MSNLNNKDNPELRRYIVQGFYHVKKVDDVCGEIAKIINKVVHMKAQDMAGDKLKKMRKEVQETFISNANTTEESIGIVITKGAEVVTHRQNQTAAEIMAVSLEHSSFTMVPDKDDEELDDNLV